MRILLMDVNCKYSSTGKIVYDLYTKLREKGHEAAIAYGRGPIVDEENIYRFSPQWEVYLHALLTRITGYTSCYSYIATKRAIKYIEKFQPDVVHLHDMHGYFINIVPLIEYLKKTHIKTVWTFHCEFMYTGKCGHSYECEQWKTHCTKCPHLKDYPQSILFDKTKKMFWKKERAFKNFDNLTIVSPSNWLTQRIKQSFFREKEIITIHNGIDTEIFTRQENYNLREEYATVDEKIILAVAPNLMSDNKGGRHILALAKKMQDSKVKFVMVGVTDTSIQVPDNVKLEGLIKDQRKLAEYYSMADVFLICSERENYPTTCIEAAACGVPVVGFDVGGTAETVDSPYGVFVEYGDIDALKNAVDGILAQENMKERMLGIRDYSKERMYFEYEQIYQE